MKNFVLLLVLVSGFLSGYLIGDYRGRIARESLKKAVDTGKTLDAEREATITQLRKELDGINDKHLRELETVRKNSAAKAAEWHREKGNLGDKIKLTTTKLTELDTQLRSLVAKRDSASGAKIAGIDLEISHLRKERDDLRHEVEGNACLQTMVPHSVSEALNEESIAGRK